MSGWGSGFPGVMRENTQRSAAAESAPTQQSDQNDSDEADGTDQQSPS